MHSVKETMKNELYYTVNEMTMKQTLQKRKKNNISRAIKGQIKALIKRKEIKSISLIQ